MGLLRRLADATERSAKAQEDLITMASAEKDERDGLAEILDDKLVDVPQCPHCGQFNPTISIPPLDGDLLDFGVSTRCGNCRQPFYLVPVGWRIFDNHQAAIDYRSKMKGGN